MTDLKHIIAKNISDLRTAKGMTQIELAEKLNYSDKAVSKWERGESLPDITVFKKIAELFDVTIDYFVDPNNDCKKIKQLHKKGTSRNHGFITGMAIILVWLIATIVYIFIDSLSNSSVHWLSFVYAIPASMVVWLIFNSIWFNSRRNFLIISLLLWTLLAALFITLFVCNLSNIRLWLIFVLGIPSQIIILFWSRIKIKNKQ